MQLEKYKEAFDILNEGLKLAPTNKQMIKLFKKSLEMHRKKTDSLIDKF